jgi:hypothetical protein
MAMQQSGKGAGEGKAPVLSDEQADQFAASFTPAWDSDDGLGDDTNGTANATLVDAPAVVIAAAPAPVPLHKQTLMGQAPAANAPVAAVADDVRPIIPSSEAIDPENILESNTAPQPATAATVAKAAPAPAAAMMKTQAMQGAPGPVAAKAQPKPGAATVRNGQAQAAQPRAAAAVALSADPFKRTDDDDDVVPKKSNKTIVFVIAGLAIAAGVGLVVKFALSDDPPKAPVTAQAVGPAVATAEIPPPPPKVEAPAAATATAAAVSATTTAAAKAPDPLPAPTALAAPTPPARPTPAEPAPHTAPAAQPRHQAAAQPPPLPAAPKTAPKPANTGIVRDNPF